MTVRKAFVLTPAMRKLLVALEAMGPQRWIECSMVSEFDKERMEAEGLIRREGERPTRIVITDKGLAAIRG